jgi:antitoxin ParD1/3/4
LTINSIFRIVSVLNYLAVNISLAKEFEEYVTTKVASGRYHSSGEVVQEGLRLLEEQDLLRQGRLSQLKREVQIGIDQVDRGEYTDYDEEGLDRLFEGIKQEGRARLRSQRA